MSQAPSGQSAAEAVFTPLTGQPCDSALAEEALDEQSLGGQPFASTEAVEALVAEALDLQFLPPAMAAVEPTATTAVSRKIEKYFKRGYSEIVHIVRL